MFMTEVTSMGRVGVRDSCVSKQARKLQDAQAEKLTSLQAKN